MNWKIDEVAVQLPKSIDELVDLDIEFYGALRKLNKEVLDSYQKGLQFLEKKGLEITVWRLTCEASDSKSFVALVEVGVDGVYPVFFDWFGDAALYIRQHAIVAKAADGGLECRSCKNIDEDAAFPRRRWWRKKDDSKTFWLGLEVCWEGQPNYLLTLSSSKRLEFGLHRANERFSKLEGWLNEEKENYGDIAPQPNGSRDPSCNRVEYRPIEAHNSLVMNLLSELRARFFGFDLPPEEPKDESGASYLSPVSGVAVEIMDLPFYSQLGQTEKTGLVNLTDGRYTRPRRARFVWQTNSKENDENLSTLKLRQLDGRGSSIATINRDLKLQLSIEQVDDYLRFACGNLYGDMKEYCAFRIVESADDFAWYPDSQKAKDLVASYIAPIRVRRPPENSSEEDPYVAGAFVYYSGNLFYSILKISRQTNHSKGIGIEMQLDFLIFENLPARPEVDSANNCFLLESKSEVLL